MFGNGHHCNLYVCVCVCFMLLLGKRSSMSTVYTCTIDQDSYDKTGLHFAGSEQGGGGRSAGGIVFR